VHGEDLVHAEQLHGLRDIGLLGDATEASRATVYRLVDGLPRLGSPSDDPALNACVRAVGDPRFTPLLGRVPLSDWRAFRDR
jgi:hypothetical protein